MLAVGLLAGAPEFVHSPAAVLMPERKKRDFTRVARLAESEKQARAFEQLVYDLVGESLTDDEWKTIAKTGGLDIHNVSARRGFDNLVFRYRLHKPESNNSPSEARKELTALGEIAEQMAKRVGKSLSDSALHAALVMEYPEGVGDSLDDVIRLIPEKRLHRLCAELQYLARWMRRAAKGVRAGRSGKGYFENVWLLVFRADVLREQLTGQKISRSYKDEASKTFITQLCRITDSRIGKGTIDKAMKKCITARRGTILE